MTRSESAVEHPTKPIAIYTPTEVSSEVFFGDNLLTQANAKRSMLKNILSFGQLQELTVMINTLLMDEEDPNTSTPLDEIMHSHFDKLIKDILCVKYETNNQSTEISLEIARILHENIIPLACKVQEKWDQKFKDAYKHLDVVRTKKMREIGMLHHIEFNPAALGEENRFQIIKPYPIQGKSKQLGAMEFQPGDWWLNMWCASRDGIVGDPLKIVTRGRSQEITALALLSGTETSGPTLDTYEYTRQGRANEMNFSILSQHGRPIRLLRGYRLKSRYAPEAGVRYDGL
jgi:hypothetical protein